MWGQWIGSAKGNINADVILNIDERIKTFGLIELNYTKEPEDNFRPIAMGLHNVTFNGNDFSADVTWVVKASPQSTNVENRIKGMLDADGNLHATMNASIGNIELDLSFQEHEVPLQSKELDWQEFKTYIGSVPYDFVGNPIWIFRGHNDSRYALRTSFHRRNRRTLQSYFNSDVPRLAYYLRPILNRDFDINDKEELISFLHLAQHHSFPTPFLDWTESPFVAAYFAYFSVPKKNEYKENERVRVYVFNQQEWQKANGIKNFLSHVPAQFSVIRPRVSENQRALPQQSVVTYSNVANIEKHILANSAGSEYLTAFDLPAARRSVAMADLRKMGITHASLFPGIEGTCIAVSETLL